VERKKEEEKSEWKETEKSLVLTKKRARREEEEGEGFSLCFTFSCFSLHVREQAERDAKVKERLLTFGVAV